ncbi:DUF4169 family protein [Pontivivens ytuae]|uniref:DUF4169 family protein n=1 Tax=Pontivivens ytuae TaxID=2789856 RepID=A0A7S9QDK2_9RHOB|nr:DUF4169 family protein [Pontivivens ytuae]QPH54980.1 DUF4169 family protein [Pontivivens ytuae]
MADAPINLRRWKKQRGREEARKEADANAARHGESKAEKVARLTEAKRAERDLDGKKRE